MSTGEDRIKNAVTPGIFILAFLISGLKFFGNDRSGSPLTDLLSLGGMWLAVAGVAGARPLWDPEFAEQYSFGRRALEVFWKYYGPIGLLVSVLYNVQLSVVNDHFDPPSWYHGGTFMVVVVVIGVALFAVPTTPFRQIGSGLFVGVAALAWPILIYPVLFLVLPYLVYLATIITSWMIIRRRKAKVEL